MRFALKYRLKTARKGGLYCQSLHIISLIFSNKTFKIKHLF